MITLTPQQPGQPYEGHLVKVKKAIGNFVAGETVHVSMMRMTKPDDRLMIFGGKYYAVGTKEEIDNAFDE